MITVYLSRIFSLLNNSVDNAGCNSAANAEIRCQQIKFCAQDMRYWRYRKTVAFSRKMGCIVHRSHIRDIRDRRVMTKKANHFNKRPFTVGLHRQAACATNLHLH